MSISRAFDAALSPSIDGAALTTRLSRRRALSLAALLTVGAGASDVAAGGKGKKIVREAKKHLDAVYVAGGQGEKDRKGRRQFDCSGFTAYVVKKAIGKTITPGLPDQARVGKGVSKGAAKAGDLMYFRSGGAVTHVAIYMGGGKIIHAMNPQLDVKISKLSEFTMKVHSVRRVT